MPYFLAEEGKIEHASSFDKDVGIVFYYSQHPFEIKHYSERYVWLTNTFSPYLHEAALYYRTKLKWPFIQAFVASRNPIKSIMSSSLTRRYMQQCGPNRDNYRLALSLCTDLRESVDIHIDDFMWQIPLESIIELKEYYSKEIKLLQLYAIQEYGKLTDNEDIMWITDELNGALIESWNEFFSGVVHLVPVITRYIIDASQKRGTFFPQDATMEQAPECNIDHSDD
ncbi:MAG: hypothetical protein ACLQVJ_06770 [Syntrophobacteraceae bacterium]